MQHGFRFFRRAMQSAFLGFLFFDSLAISPINSRIIFGANLAEPSFYDANHLLIFFSLWFF